MSAPSPKLLAHPAHLLSLGFGSGLSPIAPGTAGTAVGVLIFLPLSALPPLAYIGVTALLFVAGIGLCGATSRRLGVEDHPAIVLDEIVGFLVTMTAVPAGWGWVAAGFVAFRALDILKPWPIRLAEARIKGGLGIMVDDLIAGVLACALLQAALAAARNL